MIDVSCAIIIDENGNVLVAQRSKIMTLPLKWEFPGGKVELGETAESSIIREIKEELNVNIEIVNALPDNIHTYGVKKIRLIPFVCKIKSGSIYLKEHATYRWLQPEQMLGIDWADADLPIVYDFIQQVKARKL